MSDDDVRRLEQRIAELEARLGAQSGGTQAGVSAPHSGSNPSGAAENSPGAWLAGALAQALPPGGPASGARTGVQGAQAQQIASDSVLWCTSRFVCVTMSCGGSGWC